MEEKDLSYKLRSILHRYKTPEKITSEVKQLIELYGYDVDIHIMDTKRAMFVDVSPYAQYLKKKFNNKIYEVLPQGSPLKKYKEVKVWETKKKKPFHSKSERKRARVQTG